MGIQWFILVTVLIIFIQSVIYAKWGLSQITYSRFFRPQAVYEGEEVEMVERISNPKLLPVPWLRLESKISESLQFGRQFNLDINNEQFHRSVFSLMPYKQITRRHKVTCTKRGYYWFDSVAITTGDPFGFQSVHKTVRVAAEVLVYPKLIPMEEIPLPSHSWQGDIVVRRWIVDDPFTIAGVRDFAPGDAMNAVNWKATARMGELQVHKRDYTADHHLMVYINFDTTEDIWMPITDTELIEKGISYAASIAQYSIAQGIPTGFGCNAYLIDPTEQLTELKQSVRIHPQSSKGHLTHILESMAKLKMDRSMNFHHFLEEDVHRQTTNTDILIITSFISERTQEQINRLQQRGNAVEVLWLQHDHDQKEGVSHAQ